MTTLPEPPNHQTPVSCALVRIPESRARQILQQLDIEEAAIQAKLREHRRLRGVEMEQAFQSVKADVVRLRGPDCMETDQRMDQALRELRDRELLATCVELWNQSG